MRAVIISAYFNLLRRIPCKKEIVVLAIVAQEIVIIVIVAMGALIIVPLVCLST